MVHLERCEFDTAQYSFHEVHVYSQNLHGNWKNSIIRKLITMKRIAKNENLIGKNKIQKQ